MEEQLLERLNAHGGDDLVASYRDIARVFPSNDPHPDSFDYKLIDREALLRFASENGWQVSLDPEQAPEGFPNSPSIRFQRK